MGKASGMARRLLCGDSQTSPGQGEGKLPECTIRYFSQRLVGQWPVGSPRDAGALIAGDAHSTTPLALHKQAGAASLEVRASTSNYTVT